MGRRRLPGLPAKDIRAKCPPDTYFQLWAGLSPDRVAASDLDQLWKAETDRWGSEETFQNHWNLCRSLPHEFILCDLLERPRGVAGAYPARAQRGHLVEQCVLHDLQQLVFHDRRAPRAIPEISSMVWRRRRPALFLYGADHLNSSVNSIRSDEYAARLAAAASDAGHELMPARFHRLQIRS